MEDQPSTPACPAISILIPAFNEDACIQETIHEVRSVMDATGFCYELIVIDDGSSDDTAAQARAAGVEVVSHPANGGYGLSLKTGIRHARYDWCAILDADATYPVRQLPELLSYIPAFDMVVGARTGKVYQGSFFKRTGRAFLTLAVEYVVGLRIPDVNSGMRVFRKEIALAHTRRISAGFSFTTTITLAMLLEHHFVRYVPIEYYPRVGQSKVRFSTDILRMLQIVSSAMLYYNPLKLFLMVCFLDLILGGLLAALLAAFVSLASAGIALAVFLAITLLTGAAGFLAEAMRLNRPDLK